MTKILIVDDKEENLYYLRALLEGNQHEVISAHHGAEALVKARLDPPGVVISDLLMPVMDGYTLLRHWKADARLMQIPFIVYTATYTEEEDERLALSLGADAFILKPTEPADFIERLQEVQGKALNQPHAELMQAPRDEKAMLQYYSETLIRKLEEKTLQLEETNRALKQEIAERLAAEVKIKSLNRIYAMLSGINTLIVRVHRRDELFSQACRIATQAGEFSVAMIGMIEHDPLRLVPMASAGEQESLRDTMIQRLASDSRAAERLAAQIVQQKQALVFNDAQGGSEALLGCPIPQAGVESADIIPLIVRSEAVGVLVLYAREHDFFHEEELKLVTELAEDIAFAIDHLDKQEQLNYLAYYDVLTGFANRSLLLERLGQFMRSAEREGGKLALCLIDLERFKNFNDSLGRSAGDALLKQVAAWLTQRTGDANLLARVGNDHFAMVLPKVRQDSEVGRLIDKTLTAFREHAFQLDHTEFRIGAKVGIALYPDDGADAETVFKKAEAALKMAKKSGDRYLFHTQEMTEAVASRLSLENRLRRALDNEEFVLHYQPKLSLASGKVVGAEALIRWNDPSSGLVAPGSFISILEEIGLIYQVGLWALDKALADHLRWRAMGLQAVRIAVNVSPLQLRNPEFVADVERAIGVDAQAAAGLELEITESMIVENMIQSVARLHAIRAMGVTIAIDDFGTGFSSLGYLAQLPVDTLKVDRSFVVDMTAKPEGLALVSTIINLAHSLRLKVVAEGVETEEQSRLLRLVNCDEIQGFLFSRPVPVAEFESMLQPVPTAS